MQYLPTIRHKYFDTLAHTFLSTLHLLGSRYDAAALLQRRQRRLHLDAARVGDAGGAERRRPGAPSQKMECAGQSLVPLSEWLATWMPNAVVTDAQAIAQYYHEKYRRDSVMIPYGAELGTVETTDALHKLGLEPQKYFLYVSRMEPENNGLLVREAFERVATDLKLALIGDAPYAADYIAQVRDTHDPRIVIPGAIYGQGYRELGSHCFAYIHATEVGGTHPALDRSHGTRRADAVSGHAGERRSRRRRGPALHSRESHSR